MTYAQFHESCPGSRFSGALSSTDPYAFVFIEFSQTARTLRNGPEGRPGAALREIQPTFQQSYPHALWIAEKSPQNPAISAESCE
ncbi:hypothetical protein [Burkholderia cepacia]|uniref:hypothetical protein n=1 Tax=Burkholderia cepacia TaxID=292 RepID=UPI0011D1F8DF|nr:hypothetical protein [Burkholderia cepacia]